MMLHVLQTLQHIQLEENCDFLKVVHHFVQQQAEKTKITTFLKFPLLILLHQDEVVFVESSESFFQHVRVDNLFTIQL